MTWPGNFRFRNSSGFKSFRQSVQILSRLKPGACRPIPEKPPDRRVVQHEETMLCQVPPTETRPKPTKPQQNRIIPPLNTMIMAITKGLTNIRPRLMDIRPPPTNIRPKPTRKVPGQLENLELNRSMSLSAAPLQLAVACLQGRLRRLLFGGSAIRHAYTLN